MWGLLSGTCIILCNANILTIYCGLYQFHHHDAISLAHISVIHYCDVIMGQMASQITSLTIVYSTVYSATDQRKHQRSASLAFVRGIHRWPVNSPAQMASNAESDSISWRHHALASIDTEQCAKNWGMLNRGLEHETTLIYEIDYNSWNQAGPCLVFFSCTRE